MSTKRKKTSNKSEFHQSQSVALSTQILDDDDNTPVVRRRTVYTEVHDTDFVEDTDTLARASQLEGFSYLLGESVSSDDADDSFLSGGLNVEVESPRKYYMSTVRVFPLFTMSLLILPITRTIQ